MEISKFASTKGNAQSLKIYSLASIPILVHGIGAKLVSNWEQNMLYTKCQQRRKRVFMLAGLKVSFLACKCGFYRAKYNVKGGTSWNGILMVLKSKIKYTKITRQMTPFFIYSLSSLHQFNSSLHFKTFKVQFHGYPLCITANGNILPSGNLCFRVFKLQLKVINKNFCYLYSV